MSNFLQKFIANICGLYTDDEYNKLTKEINELKEQNIELNNKISLLKDDIEIKESKIEDLLKLLEECDDYANTINSKKN